MRELFILIAHLLVTLAKLSRPGGLGAVAAESLAVKQQLLIMKRTQRRAPQLTAWDRLILGVCALLVAPKCLSKLAVILQPSTLLRFHHVLVKRKYHLLYSPRTRRRPGPKGPTKQLTQQFNTTTSTGRLTLNVLLSFAQFEREVTGERIRDKIAASKRKGMWMGGVVPLGYDVCDRHLVVNQAEAATVREIFRRYQELGSVRLLKAELDRRGIKSKVRVAKNGTESGGHSFYRGALYTVLRNPIYIGQIRHKSVCHPGEHQAIVEREGWEQVQTILSAHRARETTRATKSAPSPLAAKLFDERGERLTPSHAVKGTRRYRYYVSHKLIQGTTDQAHRGWRLPAVEIERLVAVAARQLLQPPVPFV